MRNRASKVITSKIMFMENAMLKFNLIRNCMLLLMGMLFYVQAAYAIEETVYIDHSDASYNETVVDMKVKVLGGYVQVKRELTEDGWSLNPNWRNLTMYNNLLTQTGQMNDPGNLDEPTQDEIERAQTLVFHMYRGKRATENYYLPNGSDTSVYTHFYTPSLKIKQVETGFQWTNGLGDTIDYNFRGRMTHYENKNGIRVSFDHDEQARIKHVRDHYGNIVLTYDYSTTNQIRVSDYSGRTITYYLDDFFTPPYDMAFMKKITDVRGHDWQYEYEYYSAGPNNPGFRAISKKIDPELRTTLLSYHVNSETFTNYLSGSGAISSWGVEEVTDPNTGEVSVVETYNPPGSTSFGSSSSGSGGSSGIPAPVPAALIYTGRTYHDGAQEEIRFFYNLETRTYSKITKNSDGLYQDEWLGLNGRTKRMEIGGVNVFTRADSVDGDYSISVDARGRKTRTDYNSEDYPTKITYPDGTSVSYQYGTQYNFVTSYTDENGDITKVSYDGLGNAVKVTLASGSPDSREIEYEYDQYGQLILIRSVGNATTATSVTNIAYDANGNITQITDPAGFVTEYQDYDVLGMAKTMIDSRGKTWRFEYDAAGNQTKQTSPLGFETILEYNKVSQLVKIIDAELNETSFAYDARNRLTTTTNALGDSFTINYAMDGQPVSAVNEEGHTASFKYDRQRRLKSVNNEEGLSFIYNYEDEELSGLNRLDSIVTPNGNIKFDLDERGRVVTQTNASADDSLQLPMSYVYDKQFNVTATTDGNNNTTTNSYNPHDELLSVLNANNENTQLVYDRRGNLTTVTDAKLTSTNYSYDSRDLLVKETKHMGQEMHYAYDGEGNLVRITDSKGQVIVFTYDDDGRLVTEQHFVDAATADANAEGDASATADKTVSYNYNKAGYLTGYDDGETSAVYALDKLYRISSTDFDFGGFIKSYSYTYTKDNQIASFTNAEGVVTSYSYDNANRLKLVQISGQGSIVISEYDGNLPSKIVYPGGVTVENAYDGVGRLLSETVRDPADNILQSTVYGYDAASNLTFKQTWHGEYSYSYDPVYRLTNLAFTPNEVDLGFEVQNRQYQYDAVGNRLASEASLLNGEEESWIYNANHELERIEKGETDGSTDVIYTYDANGSTISKTIGSDVETYIYDLENRLREVQRNGSTLATYYYDPFGQRVYKEVNGIRTYFLYAQEGLVAEYSANGTLTNSMMYVPDGYWSTAPLGQIAADGEAYFYQHDQIGTPNLLTSKTGQVKWRGVADAFGRMSVVTNDLPSNGRFPGQYTDHETGYYYNYTRDYDPELGRYIQSDSIGLRGGVNRYAYSDLDPINTYDPTGEIGVGGFIKGALAELAVQYVKNNGKCIDVLDIFVSGLVGAVTLPGFGKIKKTAKKIFRSFKSLRKGVGTYVHRFRSGRRETRSYKQLLKKSAKSLGSDLAKIGIWQGSKFAVREKFDADVPLKDIPDFVPNEGGGKCEFNFTGSSCP